MFQGIEITLGGTENQVHSQLEWKIKSIAQNVLESFIQIEGQNDILKALSYFTIQNLRSQIDPAVQPQELQYLETISDFYRSIPQQSFPELVTEFKNLQPLILEAPKNLADEAILSDLG